MNNSNNSIFNNYIDLYREQISCMRELFSVQRLLIRGIQDTGDIVNRIMLNDTNSRRSTPQTNSAFDNSTYMPNLFRTPLRTRIPPPPRIPPTRIPPIPTPPIESNNNLWFPALNRINFSNRNSTATDNILARNNHQTMPPRHLNYPFRNSRSSNPSNSLTNNRTSINNRRTRNRRNLYFSNDLSNNFSFRFNNNLMTILNNSLYDYQPRRTLQNAEYDNIIESDNWTNISTRYNLPIDSICPITQQNLGNDTHQEVIRINSCGHIFSSSLREWFNFSSLCPVCRHDLYNDLNNNDLSNNHTQNSEEEEKVENNEEEQKNEEESDIEQPNETTNFQNSIQPNTIVFDFGLRNNTNTNSFTEQITNTLMRGINNIVEDNSANIINFINDISNNVPSQNIMEFEANLVNNNFTTPEFGENLYSQLISDISNNIPNVFDSSD